MLWTFWRSIEASVDAPENFQWANSHIHGTRGAQKRLVLTSDKIKLAGEQI